jgi:hypothetical protein
LTGEQFKDVVLVGSAQLTTDGNVSGFAIFHYKPSGQEAVVPLETRNASAYVLAFDYTNGAATGLALANVSNQAANVPVIIRDDTGRWPPATRSWQVSVARWNSILQRA